MSAPSPADCFAPDGEPLCLPPAPEELCEAARRRLGAVEADLRRRLSGPDRPVEAVQLERFASGLRQGGPQDGALLDAHAEDPLREQGVLALCAAQLLGMRPLVHLAEGLALRGQRVRRTSLGPAEPPRALEVIDQIHRGELRDRPPPGLLEVCRVARGVPAARTLIALAAAGLAPPLVLIDSPSRTAASSAATPPTLPGAQAPFCHAGLGGPLLLLLRRAAAPHAIEDAAAGLAPLREALLGRNPWHLYQIAEVPWRDAWAGTQVLREPQLSLDGLELARQALGRPPTAEETFALGCCAVGAAERLAALQAPPPPAPIIDESSVCEREGLLRQALTRMARRPLLQGPGGDAVLHVKQAASSGLFVVMAHHPDELGRALLPPVPGLDGRCAQLRLLSFPRERPRALVPTERLEDGRRIVFLDGGDLRAQLTI